MQCSGNIKNILVYKNVRHWNESYQGQTNTVKSIALTAD